jgi:hypothetical protein
MQGRLLDELWKVHFIDGNVSRSIEIEQATSWERNGSPRVRDMKVGVCVFLFLWHIT